MGIRDEELEGGLFEAFRTPQGESALEAIERLHGAGSSLLLRDAGEDASPILLRRDENGAKDDRRYQVLGEIARGGIGVVYKGRDKDLNRDVALKVLRAEFAERDDVIQRFIEEAQVGGQLQHPGIVPIYGLGLQADGRPSFAMKLIKGETLAELLDSNPKSIDLLAVFEQVAQTMAYAHSRGVIHRDLKPANVMVGAFGEVQVVDWGFAKVLGHEELKPRPEQTVIATVRSGSEGSQSMTGSVMGTPAYMPPEQALGQIDDLDESSDVFALGAILCEILTGKPPYTGTQKDQLIAATQCRLEPALERLAEADAAEELKRIVRDCLQPLSADRPKSARALADRLTEHFANVEERARKSELDAVESETRAAREQYGRRRALVLAAIALVAILGGGGGYLSWKSERDARELEAGQRIASALREAKGHEGEQDWTNAAAAARKAVDLAASEGVDDGGAGALLARYDREKAAADEAARLDAADQTLLDELERARALERQHYGVEAKDEAFTAALTNRWPDGKVDLERLKSSPHAEAIAAAFDDWVVYRKEALEKEDWRPIDGWARAIDPAHNELRDILAAEDVAALEQLLQEQTLDSLPVGKLPIIGAVLKEKGKKKQAVSFLRRAARLYPGEYWIHSHLGWAADDVGDWKLAIRHWQAALALRPASIEAHHWLGIALNRSGDFEGAIAVWRAALRRKPDWAHGLGHIAPVLGKLGRHDEALATFRTVAQWDDLEPGLYVRMGPYLIERGRYEEAAEAFRKAIELDPEKADANLYNWLGRALTDLGDWEGSAEAHRYALQLDRGNLVANNRLMGAVRREGGEPDEAALARVRQAIEREPDNPAHHIDLADQFLLRRQFFKAVTATRKAVELAPDEAVYHHHLGNLLSELSGGGRNRSALDQGIASLRKAVELEPDEGLYRNDLAVALRKRQRHDEAIVHLRRAVALDPEFEAARYNLAFALVAVGKRDEAVAVMREALAREPGHWRGWKFLVDVLQQTGGDEEDEIDAWRRAVELNPGLHNRFANRLGWLRRYDEAAAEYRRILKGRPEFGCAHYDLGSTLMNKGAYAEAIPEFRKAIEIYPNFAQAYCNLGGCYRDAGQWDEALVWLRKGHEMGSRRKRWPFNSADWIAQVEEMVALKPRLRRVLDGEEIEATTGERVVLAGMLFARGHYALSAQFYRDVFAADPSLGAGGKQHRYRAARAAAQAGEAWRAQALEWMRTIVENLRGIVRENPGGVIVTAGHLRHTPALAPVRDAADLPDEWKRLWAEFDELREQARRIRRGEAK